LLQLLPFLLQLLLFELLYTLALCPFMCYLAVNGSPTRSAASEPHML
jgi:hypothetical protein